MGRSLAWSATPAFESMYTASGYDSTAVANTVAVEAHLIYAGTRIASARAASGNGATANRTLYYYRTRLGSVIGTSLRGGTAGAYYRYTPYGEVDVTNETDTTRSELGYTNALRLTGGLIHLVNRAYDTEAKVFVQSDVVDRLRYTYTGGDPINRSDPTGLLQIENTNDMELAHRNPGEGATGQKPQPKGARRDAKVDRAPKGEPTKSPTAGAEPAKSDQGSGLAEGSKKATDKSSAATPKLTPDEKKAERLAKHRANACAEQMKVNDKAVKENAEYGNSAYGVKDSTEVVRLVTKKLKDRGGGIHEIEVLDPTPAHLELEYIAHGHGDPAKAVGNEDYTVFSDADRQKADDLGVRIFLFLGLESVPQAKEYDGKTGEEVFLRCQ